MSEPMIFQGKGHEDAPYAEGANEGVAPYQAVWHYVSAFDKEVLANVPSSFERNLQGIFDDAYDLLLSKHRDYGPLNIARAPGGALNGLRVRKWDKLARINHLLDQGVDPENESLRDSFLDDLNYSAIALMVLDGAWPGVE